MPVERFLFVASVAAVLLAAPVPAPAIDLNPLGLVKDAVEAAVEDRSAGDIATDAKIKTQITAKVIDQMGTDVISISADVYEQNVMLTGIVETAAQKRQAGALTEAIEGVGKVHNEILVIPDAERKKGAAEGLVDDTVIETKLNALFLDDHLVNVTNLRWRSVEGHVFLFGRALSAAERTRAISIAKSVKDVTAVTSRITVRPK